MAYKRILVPVDGSATANAGLREAIALAKDQGAELQLVHVVDRHSLVMMGGEALVHMDEMVAGLTRAGRTVLRKAEAAAKKGGVRVSTVLLETVTGPAADPIVQQAKKWRADAMVIGTHGRRGIRRLLMGSDAEQIVRSSPVPVLLVRAQRAWAATCGCSGQWALSRSKRGVRPPTSSRAAASASTVPTSRQ